MPERDPDKVIEDLENFRCDGDRERYWNEIGSSMEVKFQSNTRALVKQIYLGFVPGDDGKERLTCELATWEMAWDKPSGLWLVDGWGPDETYFQVDFTKDRIPWKKVRGLLYETDEECAEAIADDVRFQNKLIDAVSDTELEDDAIYSLIADPLLRKAASPRKKKR
jgi:hypothetical protein